MLRGHRWTAGDDLAILVHDVGRDLDVWGGVAAALVGAGYSVLAVDLPGHGLSDDAGADLPLGSAIAAIVDQVAAGARSVFLVTEGESAGASLRSTPDRAVDALVAISPNAESSEDRFVTTCPKLFIVGSGDAAALEAARSVFRRTAGWVMQSAFPVAEQGADLFAGSWGANAVEQLLLFLRDYRRR